jgi:hypothetical protein
MSIDYPIDHWTCSYCGKRTYYEANGRISWNCAFCGKSISLPDFIEMYQVNYGQPRSTAEHIARTIHIGEVPASAKSLSLASDLHAVPLDTVDNKPIELPFADRPLGCVILGQTGFGKTSLLEHLAAADIGHCTSIIFDPHGELSERILRIGAGIKPENILFCEIGNNMSYGFNPLEVKTQGDPLEESQTIDSLMQVFRKHWSDNPAYSFGSRVEWVLSNTARTILANPGYTLAEIPLLLHDKAFRDKLVRNVMNPQVQFFWGEYRQLESTRRPLDTWQMVESTVTRLTQFLANEWLYRVLYQAKGTIKFHELIDSGKTIIFSLPIGKLGEEPASLLGSLLLGKLATTIFGRNEYGKTYPRVHIYIDEYARFSIPLISQLWVQARKFNCGLTATMQTLAQIKDEESRAAILQAGNLIAFQCIGSDADIIAKQMPLPDPVSLMKPEAILVYSQTPIRDIWDRGHPNSNIRLVRDQYFWLFHELEEEKDRTWWVYPFFDSKLDRSDWKEGVFEIYLEAWRSHRQMIELARDRLNTYFFQWMNHAYSKQNWEEAVQPLVEALMSITGVLGIRFDYMPGERADWEAYLRAKAAQPRALISPREWENLITWDFVRYGNEEENLLIHAIVASASGCGKVNGEFGAALQDLLKDKIIERYCWMHWGTYTDEYGHSSTWNQYLRGSIDQSSLATAKKMALWETNNLYFASLLLSGCAQLLAKEPVFDQSHIYKDVEYNRRTYSDLREELVTKLVSLPPYQAIVHLSSQSGELPVQILTPSPLSISSDAEPKAQAVREASRKKLGHPWQEVVRDIQTRQNLPPAKPQI